jgi:hypothetical protein
MLCLHRQTHSSNIFELPAHKRLLVFSGIHDDLSRVLGRIVAREHVLGHEVAITKNILEHEYQEVLKELKPAKFLAPDAEARDVCGGYIAIAIESLHPRHRKVDRRLCDGLQGAPLRTLCRKPSSSFSWLFRQLWQPTGFMPDFNPLVEVVEGESQTSVSGYKRSKSTRRII